MKEFLVGAVLGTIFAVIAVAWVSGCGESYIDAQGVRHMYECYWSR